MTGLIFASCVNVEEPQAPDETPQKVTTRSAVEKDPYKLSLLQEVLDQHLSVTRSARIVLDPTHLYVRFLPQDSLQIVTIDALGLDTFYRPIGEEGVEIIEPEVDDDDEQTFCWIYAVVPAGFVFPQGITHEIIYESFIQGMDGQSAASGEQLPTNLYRSILNETLAMTGNSSTTRAETSQEWRPSVRFRLEVNMDDNPGGLLDTISLPALNVVVFQGSRREILYTNPKGETGEYGTFIGSVGFQTSWHNDDFIIWENNNAKRRCSYFNDNTVPLDLVFTGRSLDVVCAALYRSMYSYCYESNNSLSSLIRERGFFDVGLKNKNAGGWTGRYIRGLRRPMALYAMAGGQYRTSREIMATAFHELGHASHSYKDNTDYVWAFSRYRKKMESWAEGISYAYMNALFPNYKASLSGDSNYTSLMECLLKNGLTLGQLQHDFYSSGSWEQWRDRTKEIQDKDISNDLVDMIFAHPWTFKFDTRDMLDSHVPDNKIYVNQPVMMTLKSGGDCTVEKWELVSGSGAKVFINSNFQYFICFRQPGKKVIRATIILPGGIRVTNEKTIQVVNENILKLSPLVLTGKDFTVSLRPLSNYPNAKVNKWWADVAGTENVVIRKINDRSATFNFKKLAATRKVMAEVVYANNIKDTCEMAVRFGTEMVANGFKVIRPELGFNYDTEYPAVYIGEGQLVNNNKVDAMLRHYYFLNEITDFASEWKIADNALYFKIPSQSMSLDFIMKFSYSVNGLPDRKSATLFISNFRDENGMLN